jgi:hypothetical protein
MKDRLYEELEHVFDKFPKYRMKILSRDFNPKVGREGKQQWGMRVYTK